MRRMLVPFAVLAGSVLAGLVLVEITLRAIGFFAPVWYGPEERLGWALRPGVQGWFTREGRAYVRVNSAGLRDREHAIEKPPGVYRIAVLGDSYAEAMQVNEEETFWRLLERELGECAFQPGKHVEVINFGVSGYGTAQEYLMLETRAARYRPDLVLLAFTNTNDVRNNSPALEPEKARPFYRLAGDALVLDDSFSRSDEFASRSSATKRFERWLADRLRLVQLAHEAKNLVSAWRARSGAQAAPPGAEAGLDYSVLAPPGTAAWREAWSVTERLLAKASAYARGTGARLAVVSVTSARQIDPEPRVTGALAQTLGVKDLFYVERRLAALARREGFLAIALAPEMQKRAQAERVYFHGFGNARLGAGHWNVQGHRAAAGIIARELCASPAAAAARSATARAAGG